MTTWTDDALADPHNRPDKADRVRSMFGSIARSYDLNNRLHSFGRDQAWRRAAVKAAGVRDGDRVLDVACGTGDLAEAFTRTGASEVVGVDFTPEMLDLARRKKTRLDAPRASRLDYEQGDAMDLRFEDASFDVVSIAFGIRNVSTPSKALAEFRRVLRPGGRLVVLEFDRPPNPAIRIGHHFYTNVVMPRTATLLSRDRSGAYRYLPRSVETFLGRDEMVAALREAGFSDVWVKSL
ncbi:MAG: bifunctional demethylmenaquinone methyltransferase/2-methoxy-6-polyprenyl-1,4-benzoquinol methylase UbiE, partial [Phycisphaerales bacterium]|nr:bifunctional demethylmenaquinone methyltransferase/2-methoxy-6-polyprenyl-1,4-benzoquinol methylase UbiE [Phycisphaerales bacterium]